MEYTLYSYWNSSAAQRVRTVLAFKNIPYQIKTVPLVDGAQWEESFTKINPMSMVPILVTEQGQFTQSLAICQYLESIHPQPSLVPSELMMKIKMKEIMEIINSGIQPLQNLITTLYIDSLGGNSVQWVNQAISKGFYSIEKILEQTAGLYCIGDNITLADVFLVPQMHGARNNQVDMSLFPIISRVYNNLKNLQFIQDSEMYNHPDYNIGQ